MKGLGVLSALSSTPWLMAAPILIQTAPDHQGSVVGLIFAGIGLALLVFGIWLICVEPRR